ncbi:TIR domain-containing protein [Tepidamorphus sp. 3E244]|uniref:TIR domain-containing protein n=1 Tax=Tepidamorphus sp. 3E244 TaxID=3385498 RepID=UPI0038FCDE7E
MTAAVKTGKESATTRARVFISYSRKDQTVAERLLHALEADGFDAFLDLHDIKPGEPWRDRLGALIASAEKVIFLISPHSVVSEVCEWEVSHAEDLGKSILPVVARKTDHDLIPARLRRLNFIDYKTRAARAAAHADICEALDTDLAWEREKSRISDLAGNWDKAGRPTRLLMFADDAIRAAESWRDRHPDTSPPPTELQLDFITRSRARQVRRQRLTIAVTLVVAAVTSVLAIYAFNQSRVARSERQVAEQQRSLAEENAREAERQSDLATAEAERAEQQRDAALLTQSRFLARASREALAAGDYGNAVALARAALPEDPDNPNRPIADAALSALENAVSADRRELRVQRGQVLKFTGFTLVGPREATAASTSSDGPEIYLWGLVDLKLAATLTGHDEAIKGLRYSADGEHLLSWSDDATLRLWNARTGSEEQVLRGHDGPVSRAVFLEGEILSFGADGTARRWRASDGRLLATMEGHAESVSLAWSDHGAGHFASWTELGDIRIWNAATATPGQPIETAQRPLQRVHFDASGERLLTVSGKADGEESAAPPAAVLRDASSGEPLVRIEAGTQNETFVVIVSEQADRVLTITGSRATVRSMHSGSVVAQLRGNVGDMSSAAFSPDGERILTWSQGGNLHLWEAASGRLIAEMPGHAEDVSASSGLFSIGTLGATFSPEGDLLLTWGVDRLARLRDGRTGQLLATLRGHKGKITYARFHEGGTAILTASGYRLLDKIWHGDGHGLDDSIRLWRTTDGSPVATLGGNETTLMFGEVLEKSRRLWTLDWNGTARLWDIGVDSSSPRVSLSSTGAPVAMAEFAANGRALVTASGKLFTSGLGNVVGDLSDIRVWPIEAEGSSVRTLEGSFDGYSAAPAAALAGTWSANAGLRVHRLLEHDGLQSETLSQRAPHVDGMALSADGKRLAAWAGSARVQVIETGAQGSSILLDNEGTAVTGATFSPDAGRLVTWSATEMIGPFAGPNSNVAHVWDTRTGREILQLTGHEGQVAGAVFTDEGNRVVTWSGGIFTSDGTVRIWDAADGTLLRTLSDDPPDDLLSASVNHVTGDIAALAIGAGVVVWRADGEILSGNNLDIPQIIHHSESVVPPSYSTDGRYLLVIDGNGDAVLRETETYAPVRVLRHSGKPFIGARFSPDGRWVATWAHEAKVKLWAIRAENVHLSGQSAIVTADRIIAELDPLTRLERCAYFLETEEACAQPRSEQ